MEGEDTLRHKIIVKLWVQRLSSYFIVLLGFCAVLFPLYGLMRRQTERALLTDATEKLAVSVNTLQVYVKEVQYVANKLFSEDVYMQLSANDNEMLVGNKDLLYQASGKLQDLTFNMTYSAYSYITFTRNHAVIDDYRFFSKYTEFYPGAFEYQELSLDEWMRQPLPSSTTILPARTVVLNRTAYPSDYVTLLQPFISTSGSIRGCFTVLVSVKTLSTLFLGENYRNENGLFALMQRDGTMIAQHHYDGSGVQLLANGSGALEQHGGSKYYVVTREIPNLDAVVAVGIPYASYVENLREVDRALFLYLIVGVVIGLLLSLLITANDVRKLRPFLNQLAVKESAGRWDLYKLLSGQLGNYQQLLEQLSQLRMQISHGRMEDLLRNGTIRNDTERIQLSEQLMLKTYNYLLLITPSLHAYQPVVSSEMDLMVISSHFKDCLEDDAFTYRMSEGLVIVVLSFSNDPDQTLQNMEQKTRELHDLLELDAPIIVSDCFSEVSQLSELYWRARNAAYYADKAKPIAFISSGVQQQAVTANITQMNRLNEYLLAGCMTEAQSLVADMFPIQSLSPQNFQQVFYSVRGILLTCAQKVGCEGIEYLCEWDGQLSAYKQVENIKDCCFEICNQVDSTKRSHNEDLQKKLLAWLEENFHQTKLNLAMAAAQFHISQKYVSQFLRDQTGKSFTEYVENLRLTKALSLLKNSQRSLVDISAACGFSTQNTFYKAFKRRYHVSPSSIRKGDKMNDEF